MIKRLSDHSIFTLVILLLFALCLRLPALWIIPKSGIVFKPGLLFSWVDWINQWPVFSVLISAVIVMGQALFVNFICRTHGLVQPVGYLPAYFFILVQSLFPENLLLTEYHLGNLLVFIGLACFFQLKDGYNTVTLFYGSLCFGAAILIVPDHLMILLFLIACVLVYKNIVISDILAIVFGLVMPYYLMKSLAFIFQWDLKAMHSVETTPIDMTSFGSGISLIFIKYTVFALFSLFVIFGMLRQIGGYFQNNVNVRRSKLVVILFFVYSIFLMLIHWKEIRNFHLLAAFPAAIFLASFFSGERIPWWKELLNYILLGSLVYSLYSPSYTL
jgi:hypothetical protein